MQLIVFLDFYYSNIQGEYEGEENMNIDPLFVDPANGNYTLQGNSPCIDSGTLDNIPYYCGDAPDIGAFEFISEECVDECDGYIMDQCGICDGDGLSCLDCCDVINGDNSTCGGNGNVNGGGLNVTDIVAIVELILEIELFDECQNNDADVNLDGSLNIMDVLVLVEWILNDSAPFVFDIDGNVYNIIEIGNQSWMKENLKVTHYRNGDGIPTNHTAIEWVELTSGAYSFYNNDPVNIIIFGNIYNYYAVDDERGLCPEGWHVPSDDEWTSLAMYLDPSASPDAVGYQSEIAGGMLKETGTIEDGDGYWHDPNEGATNETGFSARAGGARNGTSTGHYLYMGTSNYYWTSTEYSSNDIWYRRLNKYSAGILRVHWDGGSGYSVRCIQD